MTCYVLLKKRKTCIENSKTLRVSPCKDGLTRKRQTLTSTGMFLVTTNILNVELNTNSHLNQSSLC